MLNSKKMQSLKGNGRVKAALDKAVLARQGRTEATEGPDASEAEESNLPPNPLLKIKKIVDMIFEQRRDETKATRPRLSG